MNVFPNSARAFGYQLQHDFVDATRPARHPDWLQWIAAIQSDQAFDARKIVALLRQLDPAADFPLLVDAVTAGEQITLEPASECLLWQPAQPDHYIFQRLATPQQLPSLQLYRFRDVVLSYNLNPLQYYLFDAAGRLLDRLICGATPFQEPPIAEVAEPVVFADDIFPAFNICHLLFDKFPRIQHLHHRAGVQRALLVNGGTYIDQLLQPWDVSASSLRSYGPRGSVRLKEAWFFSNSFGRIPHPGRFGSPVYSAAFQACRAHFGIGDHSPSRRLFVHRPDGGPRSITNLSAVEALLKRWSIELVDPGALPFQQQVALFASADFLIGVHGAGLTNMLFMPPGGTVLELLPPMCATASYWGIASALGITYRHLVCHDPELGAVDARDRPHSPQHNRRRVELPIPLLEAELNQLLG